MTCDEFHITSTGLPLDWPRIVAALNAECIECEYSERDSRLYVAPRHAQVAVQIVRGLGYGIEDNDWDDEDGLFEVWQTF